MSKIKKMAMGALLIAMDIIFTRFLAVEIPAIERISLQFLAHALSGLFLGPVWAMVTVVLGDILGMLINSSSGAFFIGFTISAALKGLLYGLFLYKGKLSYLKTLLSVAAVSLGIDLALNSLWMSVYYGKGYFAVFVAKLPIRLVYIPVAALVIYLVGKGLKKALKYDKTK